jgi:hypothetical protein
MLGNDLTGLGEISNSFEWTPQTKKGAGGLPAPFGKQLRG